MSDALHFTRGQLAQLLGVTTPTISAAIDEGAPGVQKAGGRGKPSRIDGRVFVPWFLERERTKIREESKGKSLVSQERELDIEIKREKLARDRKEMVPRTAFVFVVRDILSRINISLDQVPSREADAFVGIVDRFTAVDRLTLLMDQLRADLRAPEQWMPAEEPALELSA